uniref:Uncharacterized protein n=1 Tax=Rhizophora mucronata TaxID=61149 RepID=A0A2P2PEB1_RHIMU
MLHIIKHDKILKGIPQILRDLLYLMQSCSSINQRNYQHEYNQKK